MKTTATCESCGLELAPGYFVRPCSKCRRRICDPCVDPYNREFFACRDFDACAAALEKLEIYRLEFRLEGLPTPERNSRRHWRTMDKERAGWHKAVWFTVRPQRPAVPLLLARAVYTRHSAHSVDPTNLAESFKSIEDGLVRAGILADDKAENYTGGTPDYRWQRAPQRRGFVTIVIEEGNTDGEEESSQYHLDG